MKNKYRKKSGMRVLCLLLCALLAVPMFLQPVSALYLLSPAVLISDPERRYCADNIDVADAQLYASGQGYLVFTLQGIGAKLWFVPHTADGIDGCNALRFHMANGTSAEELQVKYRRYGSETEYTVAVQMTPNSSNVTCLVHIDDLETVSEVTVRFSGAKSGYAVFYSVNAVSAVFTVTEEIGTVGECRADLSAGTVTVSGRLFAGMDVTYSGAKLKLYRIPFGSDLTEVLSDPDREALGEVKLTGKYTFTVPAPYLSDRLDGYLVTVQTAEEEFPLTNPVRVSSYGTETQTETQLPKTGFMGIASDKTASVISLGAENVMLDVMLDKLLSGGATGLAYSANGMTLSLDRSAVAELDAEVASLSAVGARVVLRLLVSPEGETELSSLTSTDAAYRGIAFADTDARQTLHTLFRFLVSRYSKEENGIVPVSGYVLGSSVDRAAESNDCGEMMLSSYAKQYADVVILLHQVCKLEGANAEIFVPISDVISSDLIGKTECTAVYDQTLFLRGVCDLVTDAGFDGVSCLLECRGIPYEVTKTEDGGEYLAPTDAAVYSGANIAKFESFLSACGKGIAYDVLWRPDETLPLSASYLYTYTAFSTSSGARVLYADLNEEELEQLSPVIHEVAKNGGNSPNDSLAELFGVYEWSRLFPGESQPATAKVCVTLSDGIRPSEAEGTFEYWNFATAGGTLNWFADANVQSLGLTVPASLGKSLTASPSFEKDERGGMYYRFTYPEELSAADALCFKYQVEDGDGLSSMFEVTVSLHGDGFVAETKFVTEGGTVAEKSVNVRNLPGAVNTVRITVRSVSGTGTGCTLYLRSVTALSETLSDTELKNTVLENRETVRHAEDLLTENTVDRRALIVLAFLILSTAILISVVVLASRKDKHAT